MGDDAGMVRGLRATSMQAKEHKTSRVVVLFVATAIAVGACGAPGPTESSIAPASGTATTGTTPPATTGTEPPATAPEDSAPVVAEASSTTSTVASAVSTTNAPSTTLKAGRVINGQVDFVDQVGFSGSIDGERAFSPQVGKSCSGEKGYADLAPGGSVIIADGSGAALATTKLQAGTTISDVKSTKTERDKREELIDAIYDLRAAKAAGDRVKVAQLNLQRAELRLKDLNTPGPPPAFEGHPFWAQWCRLTFTTPDLPDADVYQVSVTHRGATSFSSADLAAKNNVASLVVGGS